MRRFNPHLFKILIFQDHVTAPLVLESFDDLIRRNFLRIGFGYFFVSDWAQVAGAKLSEAKLFLACGWINRHGNINQPKADTAFPDRSHIGSRTLFSHSSRGVSTFLR